MNEELLTRSSQNLATLLQIFLLHEQNIARAARRERQDNNPLGDLINIVFTNENLRRNTRNEARNDTRNQANYSEHAYSDIIRPIYTECPITQEAFQETDRVVMVRGCRHLFKRDAFHEWLEINQTCPYCRSPL
jgi:hypothetical protein